MAHRILGSYLPKNNNRPTGNGLCCVMANFCKKKEVQYASSKNEKQIYSEENDIQMIKEFFQGELCYKFKQFLNSSKNDFVKALRDIKKMIGSEGYEDIDRLFVFVLSHGGEEGIIMCNQDGTEVDMRDGIPQTVPVEELTSFFDHSNIPALKGHPKCIFIQCCRGTRMTFTAAVADRPNVKALSSLPNSRLSEPNLEQDEQQESQESEVTANVVKQTLSNKKLRDLISKEALTPSSENILVYFSSLKGEASYVDAVQSDSQITETKSKFIKTLIPIFQEFYKEEHLQDMVVEATNRLRTDLVSNYSIPLIFEYDSAYQATIEDGPENDIDFSIEAKDMGKVVEFPNNTCIILHRSKNLTDEDGSLVLQCVVKYKPNGNTIEVKQSIQGINQDFLGNDNFEIDNSHKNLLFSGDKTVGYGSVRVVDKKVAEIANEVQDYESIPTADDLEICYKSQGGENKEPSSFIKDKTCKIWHLGPRGRKLVAVGEGSVENKRFENGKELPVPKVFLKTFQLPIFESTFTKKLYLSTAPVSR